MFKVNKIKVKYLHELTETLVFLYFSHVISEGYSESSRTTIMELSCENRLRLLVFMNTEFSCFYKKSPSEMFDWVLNTFLNLNITLKNLKIVLIYLQKCTLSESLVVYT